MNIAWHAATAIPFAVAGHWEAAIGCVAPDITWAINEYRYRRVAHRYASWQAWAGENAAWIGACNTTAVYRLAHSFLFMPVTLALFSRIDPRASSTVAWFAAGWFVHLLCDLPTHYGVLQARPLYPFSDWKWPWVLGRVKNEHVS